MAEIILVQIGVGDPDEIAALASSLAMHRGDNCGICFAFKTQDTSNCPLLTGNRTEFLVTRNRIFARFLQARHNQARRKRDQAASQAGKKSQARTFSTPITPKTPKTSNGPAGRSTGKEAGKT